MQRSERSLKVLADSGNFHLVFWVWFSEVWEVQTCRTRRASAEVSHTWRRWVLFSMCSSMEGKFRNHNTGSQEGIFCNSHGVSWFIEARLFGDYWTCLQEAISFPATKLNDRQGNNKKKPRSKYSSITIELAFLRAISSSRPRFKQVRSLHFYFAPYPFRCFLPDVLILRSHILRDRRPDVGYLSTWPAR